MYFYEVRASTTTEFLLQDPNETQDLFGLTELDFKLGYLTVTAKTAGETALNGITLTDTSAVYEKLTDTLD